MLSFAPRRRTALFLAAACLGAATIVFAVIDHRGGGSRSPLIHVIMGRRSHALPEGTTLGAAVARFHLEPPSGNLVAVDGKVLRRGTVHGTLLLDGRAAPMTRRLRSGDRITVRPAHDRREPLTRQIVAVPDGLPPNPQFTLDRVVGDAVVVRGAISRKLVGARFRSSGDVLVTQPGVALTFDDGPSPVYTPQILAVLRRFHVEATFFVVGYLAEWYPNLIEAELAAGMDVGNHTYNHPEVPPFGSLPARLRNDEIALAAASLRRAGADPTMFRPPAGSVSAAVVRSAARLGERVVLWSVDPDDWQRGTTASRIVHNVLAAVRPGAIIELHDGGGDRSATVAALPAIIKGVRRRGMRFVTTNGF